MMNNNKQRGVSLIELLVTVAVAAILAAVAAPNISQMIERNRVSSMINNTVMGLYLMRSEATKTNQRVLICPADAQGSDLTCKERADLSAGMVGFIDYNGNGILDSLDVDTNGDGTADKPEAPLFVMPPINPAYTIQLMDPQTNSLSTSYQLNYLPNGTINPRTNTPYFLISKKSNQSAFAATPLAKIYFDLTGRVNSCLTVSNQPTCANE